MTQQAVGEENEGKNPDVERLRECRLSNAEFQIVLAERAVSPQSQRKCTPIM